MSLDDVTPSEMRMLRGVTPQNIDRLLSGHVPAGGVELDDLTGFFRDLGEAFPSPRVDALEGVHLAAMMAAAEEVRETQAETSSTKQLQPVAPLGYLFALRRKVAVASTAALTAFSGMAVAGVLPPPLQSVVADTAGRVGIDLPGQSGSEDASETAEESPGGAPSVEEPSSEFEEKGVGRTRRAGAAGSDSEGSQTDSDRRRDEGAAPAGTDADAADEDRDGDEDASGERADAEEDATDEARDRDEDAADDAEEADERATDEDADRADEDADRAEEAADPAEDADEEASDEGADSSEDAADATEDAYGESLDEVETGD